MAGGQLSLLMGTPPFVYIYEQNIPCLSSIARARATVDGVDHQVI